MSRLLSSFALIVFVATLGGLADAKSCRDSHGKFAKCKTAAVKKVDSKGRCHGANGKFVKCK